MRCNNRVVLGLLVTALFAFAGPASALSFDAEAYFKGKTIRLVTGSRPGGGTDIALRYFAAYWGQFFPGNPRLTVSNVPPHVHGLNYVWKSRPDGLTVFMHSSAPLREQTLPAADFRSSQFKYVGEVGDRTYVLTGYKLPFRDIREAMGAKGPPLLYLDLIPSPEDMHPHAFLMMLLADWLKIPVKFGVVAERGTGVMLLEMERGNMNVMIGGAGRWLGFPKLRPGWVAKGDMVPLLDISWFGRRMLPNEEFTDIKKVPHIYDLLNKEQREIWTGLIEAPGAMDKPILLSPKTPDGIVAVYRKALGDAMNDKKFQAGIEKITGIPAVFATGEEAQKEAMEGERLWLQYKERETILRRDMYNKYIRR
jgi:hypothetical protein